MTTDTTARLHFPWAPLRGCIFWGVERDTRGVALNNEQRFNYYPASPMASISWIFEGALRMVADPYDGRRPEMGPPLARVVFAGPHRHPTASWSSSSVHALSVSFFPEAIHGLFGIQMDAFIDRVLPLEEVISGPVLDELLGIDRKGSEGAFLQIQHVLHPHWLNAIDGDVTPTIRGWISTLTQRAAFTEMGLGVRQLQRRWKQLTGQSQRELQIYARTERAFAYRSESLASGGGTLADLAAQAGFADQSHMGREIHRVTGLSPGRIEDLMKTEEAFWFYRLMKKGLY